MTRLVGGGVAPGWGLLLCEEGWEASSWLMMEGGPVLPGIFRLERAVSRPPASDLGVEFRLGRVTLLVSKGSSSSGG